MITPARFLTTPLSRERIARLVITPQRVPVFKITSAKVATPFSTIARLTITAL